MIVLAVIFLNESFAQFRFVHISDIHISDADSYVNNSDINGEVFTQMLHTLNSLDPKPAFVVASGDISNVGEQGDGMYDVLTQFLYPAAVSNPAQGDYFIDSAMSIPIYFTPGNHEYYYFLTPPLSSTSLDNYPAFVAPEEDFAFGFQNAIVLLMMSGYEQFRPIWEDNNITCPEGSGLSAAQLTWMQSVLDAHPGMKKIVVMHHPPVNVAGTNADGSPNTGTILDPADGSILNNRESFLEICDTSGVDITLSGHVHQNVVADINGNVVAENWTGGCRYIQTGACVYGNYRIISVDSSFVWVGLPQQLSTSSVAHNHDASGIEIIYHASTKYLSVVNKGSSEFESASVKLFGITGSVVYETRASVSAGSEIIIPASALSAGTYILSFTTPSVTHTSKVVVY